MWQAIRSLEVTMINKILIWLYLSVAMGVFFAVTIFGTVAILQTIFG